MDTTAILSTIPTALFGLLIFLGRNVLSDIEKLKAELADQKTQIAVMNAGRLGERVEALEKSMNRIERDVTVIRHWVESQDGRGHFHRRAEDPQDG